MSLIYLKTELHVRWIEWIFSDGWKLSILKFWPENWYLKLQVQDKPTTYILYFFQHF